MSTNGQNGHRIFSRGMKLSGKRKTVKVYVEDLDCDVILKQLSIAQMAEITEDVTLQLATMIVDEAGERIYVTDEEILELKELSHATAKLLIMEAAKLNGVSKEAMETALKNSAASRSVGSVSA